MVLEPAEWQLDEQIMVVVVVQIVYVLRSPKGALV